MTRYEGDIFGFHYDVEFKTVEEFEEWLYQKLRTYMFSDITIKVLDKVLNDTDTIKQIKVKIK